MQKEDNLRLEPIEKKRLNERLEGLQPGLERLREAAEGQEPLSNVMDLDEADA